MKPPSRRSLADLQAAVQTRMGFAPPSVGDQSLLRAVCQRAKERHFSGVDPCIAQLLNDALEFEAFAETLLVPETWFFRDRQPFRCLQDYAIHRWRLSPQRDRLRILSIPCSTGEEPYSIAMALLDVGLSPSQFTVDAADLSQHALSRAADAVYGKGSFRGDEAEFPGLCSRFLEPHLKGFVPNAQLRAAVRFQQANLLSPSLFAGQPRYHVIFCRNVLIYFGADARRTTLANLHRLLLPEGLLYVGHVEARIVMEGAFHQFGGEYPFAFAPTTAMTERSSTAAPVPTASAASSSGGARVARGQVAKRAPNRARDSAPVGVTPRPLGVVPPLAAATAGDTREAGTGEAGKLASARAAADAGLSEEAIGFCLEVLEREPANAEAICLLGLVQKTRGQAVEAEAMFQKVLYLQPRHEEALIHMMLLAEQRGDERSAANFRRRAEQAHRQETDR